MREQQDQKQQDNDHKDGPEHLYPPWCAGVVVDVDVRARVSHVR
jgi:hypothetical protein